MLQVITSEVKRRAINTEYGEALVENGVLFDCTWDRGKGEIDFSDFTNNEWIDLMTFLAAVWQEIVGKHGVIMAISGTYIYVQFEEGADLESIVTYYCGVYKMREGKEPNCLIVNPDERTGDSYSWREPLGLKLARKSTTPIGTFMVGYEEPKDAEASVSD